MLTAAGAVTSTGMMARYVLRGGSLYAGENYLEREVERVQPSYSVFAHPQVTGDAQLPDHLKCFGNSFLPGGGGGRDLRP